jgi:carboxylesterase
MTPEVRPGAEPFAYDAGPVGILLLHGFTGSPASTRPVGAWLADHGVSSVGPRLPGHGTSWQDLERTTWQDWAREAEAGLDELTSRCDEAFVFGLSMGGAMALHVAVRHASRLRGVVTVNVDMRRPELALAPGLKVVKRTAKGVGNDIKRPGQDEVTYDRVPLAAANHLGKLYRTVERELSTMRLPYLALCSTVDHVVKKGVGRWVFDHVGSTEKEFVPLPNSYHVATLDHDAELICDRTLGFIRLHAAEARPA